MSTQPCEPGGTIPERYEEFVNKIGIVFWIPKQEAAADVPYSLKVMAGSLDRHQIENADGYLPTDGMQPMEGNLDLGGFKAINSAEPVDAQDVATRNYVDLADATKANIDGDDFQGKVTVKSPDPNEVGGSFGARNIWLSTADPTTEGVNGDIWVKYTP